MPGRRGLWLVSALVLLAHAALLAQLSTAPPPPRGQAGVPVKLLYARAVQPTVAATSPEALAPPALVEAAAVSPEAGPPDPALKPPPQDPLLPPAPQPPVEGKSGPVSEPPPAPMPAQAASAAGEAPYVPRGELSVAPRLLTPVQVPFPESVGGFVDLKVRITLFIDEQGVVRRVRVDTPDVPAIFEQSIRDTFTHARFSPGEMQEVAVRSQVRIEVEFSAAGSRRR